MIYVSLLKLAFLTPVYMCHSFDQCSVATKYRNCQLIPPTLTMEGWRSLAQMAMSPSASNNSLIFNHLLVHKEQNVASLALSLAIGLHNCKFGYMQHSKV
jgi:hypothetical protein